MNIMSTKENLPAAANLELGSYGKGKKRLEKGAKVTLLAKTTNSGNQGTKHREHLTHLKLGTPGVVVFQGESRAT